MSDIIAPPPPPAKRMSRSEKWIENGLKIVKPRVKRKPRRITVAHAVRMPKSYSDVLRDMEEKWDVSISSMCKRFVEDGIKKYAPDLCAKAGIETASNPFDTFTPAEPYSYTPEHETRPKFEIPDDFIAPSGGPPVERAE